MKQIYTRPKRDLKAERIFFLKKYAMDDWIRTRQEADQEVSDEHSMKCVCGSLCTGLHETYCQKFKAKVDTRTIQKLKHLWEEKKIAFPKILK